jgi:hypothetical protein
MAVMTNHRHHVRDQSSFATALDVNRTHALIAGYLSAIEHGTRYRALHARGAVRETLRATGTLDMLADGDDLSALLPAVVEFGRRPLPGLSGSRSAVGGLVLIVRPPVAGTLTGRLDLHLDGSPVATTTRRASSRSGSELVRAPRELSNQPPAAFDEAGALIGRVLDGDCRQASRRVSRQARSLSGRGCRCLKRLRSHGRRTR